MSVERIVEKHGIPYKVVGNSLQVRCLSPEHEDNNPSMFINTFSGWANCRSCGISYNIFELLNEKANWLQVRKDKFRELLRKKASELNYLEFPETAVFWKDSYRGISKKTMMKFQAFQCAEFPGYLSFPVKNASGKIINFIGRDTTGTRSPKYLLFDKKPILMYPKNNSRFNSIILVEGLFDALNLYDKGLTNARAIFGTITLVNEMGLTPGGKDFLNTIKIEGIDEVILMFDGDDAGKTAASRLKAVLDEEYISNKVITLPNGTDPGELSQDTVDKIKEKLYGQSSNSREQALAH